jgi:hypothetical protein
MILTWGLRKVLWSVGLGSRQVYEIVSNRGEMTLRNRSILHFLRAKKLLFAGVYGKGGAELCRAAEVKEGCEKRASGPRGTSGL